MLCIISINAILGSKILIVPYWLKNSGRNLFHRVAETLVETCFCQDGLNLGLNQCYQKLGQPCLLVITDRWMFCSVALACAGDFLVLCVYECLFACYRCISTRGH